MGLITQALAMQGNQVRTRYRDEYDWLMVNVTDIIALRGDAQPEIVFRNWLFGDKVQRYLLAWGVLNIPNFKIPTNTLKLSYEDTEVSSEGIPEKKLWYSNGIEKSISKSITGWVTAYGFPAIWVVRGRNGGIFVHKDILVEFCGSISPELQPSLQYAIRIEDARLDARKQDKIERLSYTDTVKAVLIDGNELSKEGADEQYAKETDLPYEVVFNMCAKKFNSIFTRNKGIILDRVCKEYIEVLDAVRRQNEVLLQMGFVKRAERRSMLSKWAKKKWHVPFRIAL